MDETPSYSIPKRQANSILIALISLVGVVATAYYHDRPSVIVDAPDRFTGSDWLEGKAELQRHCRENTASLQRQIDVLNNNFLDYQNWKEDHTKWGRELSGRNNAMFEEIYRRLP